MYIASSQLLGKKKCAPGKNQVAQSGRQLTHAGTHRLFQIREGAGEGDIV